MTKHSQRNAAQAGSRLPIWMLLITIAGVALIVVALAGGNDNAAANFKPDVTGAPKLQADKEQVDLGTIALGQTVDVKFDVTNTGDRPLTFTDVPYVQVVKGCCAPTPEIGARTLQPGKHTTVLVSFMMHEGMGGYHDFRLHLLSNDPGQRDKTVQILSNWQ